MLAFPLPLLSNKQGALSKARAQEQCLNLAEECALRCGLEEIRVNEDFEGTQFWGKIKALRCEYLIVDAVTKPKRGGGHKYFYSSDGALTWLQLPAVEPWMDAECMRIAAKRFTGIQSHIYSELPEEDFAAMQKAEAVLDASNFAVGGSHEEDEDSEAAEDTDNDDAQSEESADPSDAEDEKGSDDAVAGGGAVIVEELTDEQLAPPKWFECRLTELHRVAWTVLKISGECFVTPKGALMLTSAKRFLWKPHFAGLSRAEANSLQSYLHFRRPQTAPALSVFKKVTASNDDDFLDVITGDVPRNVWRLKSKAAGTRVSLTNLLWPGFEFRYDLISRGFSQHYFGYGNRVSDIIYLM